MPNKSTGIQGKVLHSQSRELIANVMQFMREEADQGLKIPLKNFKERVLAATKISDKSYRKICKEAKEVASSSSSQPLCFSTPRKNRTRSSRKSTLLVGEMQTIRTIIHDYAIIEKKHPTLKGKS